MVITKAGAFCNLLMLRINEFRSRVLGALHLRSARPKLVDPQRLQLALMLRTDWGARPKLVAALPHRFP